MNKIFVIDGTDGSGKKTQAKLLRERLIKAGYQVASFPFPNYKSLSSGPVRMYLEGEISQNPNDISEKAASSLYAVDRYITYQKEMKALVSDDHTIILLDRYTSANLIHQGAKIVEKYGMDQQRLDHFIDWVYHLEYKDLGLPVPTQTFFMNMPIEIIKKLIENRPDEITGNSTKDIHERNFKHLENALTAGLYTANKLNWHVINCMENGELRSIEDINDEIYQEILKTLSD